MVASVEVARALLQRIAELCASLQVDGHRGELTITRAARALAAFEGRKRATDADVRRVALLALQHRQRRDPLEQTASRARIEQAIEELFGADETDANQKSSAHKTVGPDQLSPEDDDAGKRAANRPTRTDPDGRASETRSSEQTAPPAAGRITFDLRSAQTTITQPRRAASSRHLVHNLTPRPA